MRLNFRRFPAGTAGNRELALIALQARYILCELPKAARGHRTLGLI